MARTLLVNPSRRRKARKSNPSPAQRRARAAFARMARSRARNPIGRRRRRNPVAVSALPYTENPIGRRRRSRRSNPIALRSYRRAARRRSNPITVSGVVNMLQSAAVQGVGAVAMDVAFGYINPMLPATMRATPGQLTVGTGVKAVLTAVLGKVLDKPTRGLSLKAATGSLTVQFRDVVANLLPAGTIAGRGSLGYSVPAQVINRSARVGPNRTALGMYTNARTPLLNAYTPPGVTQLLNGSARVREGYSR